MQLQVKFVRIERLMLAFESKLIEIIPKNESNHSLDFELKGKRTDANGIDPAAVQEVEQDDGMEAIRTLVVIYSFCLDLIINNKLII